MSFLLSMCIATPVNVGLETLEKMCRLYIGDYSNFSMTKIYFNNNFHSFISVIEKDMFIKVITQIGPMKDIG